MRSGALVELNHHSEMIVYLKYHLNDTLNLDETEEYVGILHKECETYLALLKEEGFELPEKALAFDPFEGTRWGRTIRSSDVALSLRASMSRLIRLMKEDTHIRCIYRYAETYLAAIREFLKLGTTQIA